MSQGRPIKNRRPENRWQPCWLVKTVSVVFVTGILLNGWAAYASSEKDSAQDSRLTAVETNQTNILTNQEDQKILTRELIRATTETNLLVRTHIASNRAVAVPVAAVPATTNPGD